VKLIVYPDVRGFIYTFISYSSRLYLISPLK